MKRLLLLLFLSPIFSIAFGQPIGDYLKFGLGYGFQTVKDQSLSPVSYSGSLGQLNLGYYSQSEKWLSEFEVIGLGGFQHPDIDQGENPSSTTSGMARLRYALSRQLSTIGEWRFYGGLSSLNSLDYRNHNKYSNSESNYTSLFALGITAGVQNEFEWLQKRWGAQFFVDLPVATYYLRPGYVKPFLNGDIGSKGVAWWGDFMIINMRSNLIYYLNNGNQLRLNYYWEYWALQPLNKVQTATHQISLCAVFKF